MHPSQEKLDELVETDGNKVVACPCGRRWGKTFYGARALLLRALGRLKTRWEWVAPSYDLTRECWDIFHELLWRVEEESSVKLATTNKQERSVVFRNGSQILWRSADDPKSLRSRGFDGVMTDESSFVTRNAYEHAILPSLADRDGQLVLFGTPAGRGGFFFECWQMAMGGEPGYAQIRLPSTDNPNPAIKRHVELARRMLPPMVFAQEYLAEFTEDHAALFRGLDKIVGGELEEPRAEMHYVGGVDLAKTTTWTVVEMLRLSAGPPYPVVHEFREHLVDWPEQIKHVDGVSKRFNRAPLIVDETGLGGPVLSFMRQQRMPVTGYTFNETTVKEMLDALALGVGDMQIRIPGALEGLLEEMRSMAVTVDDETGKTKYVSRSGLKDRVMALGLAWRGVPATAAVGVKAGRVSDAQMKDAGGDAGLLDRRF